MFWLKTGPQRKKLSGSTHLPTPYWNSSILSAHWKRYCYFNWIIWIFASVYFLYFIFLKDLEIPSLPRVSLLMSKKATTDLLKKVCFPNPSLAIDWFSPNYEKLTVSGTNDGISRWIYFICGFILQANQRMKEAADLEDPRSAKTKGRWLFCLSKSLWTSFKYFFFFVISYTHNFSFEWS